MPLFCREDGLHGGVPWEAPLAFVCRVRVLHGGVLWEAPMPFSFGAAAGPVETTPQMTRFRDVQQATIMATV